MSKYKLLKCVKSYIIFQNSQVYNFFKLKTTGLNNLQSYPVTISLPTTSEACEEVVKIQDWSFILWRFWFNRLDEAQESGLLRSSGNYLESPDLDLFLIPNSMCEFAQISISLWASVSFFGKYKMKRGRQEEEEVCWC